MRGRANPNPPKNDKDKSRPFNFRLNPSDPKAVSRRENDAIAVIDSYLADGKELREIMTIVLVDHFDRDVKFQSVPKPENKELAELKEIVKYIAVQIENGVLVQHSGEQATPKKKGKKTEGLPANVASVIGRYMSLGEGDE